MLTTALNMTVSILKLRIASFIALAALMGILAGGGSAGVLESVVFCLAVLGASGAAGGFNQYYERDTDRLMARTHVRPFASGTLRPGAVWPLSFLGLLSASLLMAWSVGGTLATVFVFLGAVTYGLVYTVWLKQRTVWNVVIGGAAGSFAVLAGAAMAAPVFGPPVSPVAVVLAVVLFLWTPPHFWALAVIRAEDYRRAGIPMLPAVSGPEVWGPVIFSHVAALVALSFLPLWQGLGAIYGAAALVGGALFLRESWRLMRAPTRERAKATFRASLAQFALLSCGVILDRAAAWAI